MGYFTLEKLWSSLSFEAFLGDLRAVAVGSASGVIVTTLLFASSVREYTVDVNDSGYGKPSTLFEFAQEQDPTLKIEFRPHEFKDLFVCEFKLVTGDNWKKVVLTYLDSYRECFDVSARGQKSFVVSPNFRNQSLKKIDATYFCKCNK